MGKFKIVRAYCLSVGLCVCLCSYLSPSQRGGSFEKAIAECHSFNLTGLSG